MKFEALLLERQVMLFPEQDLDVVGDFGGEHVIQRVTVIGEQPEASLAPRGASGRDIPFLESYPKK